MKAGKIIRKAVLALAVLLVGLLVTVQFVLRPATLTRIVNTLAADYVEGDVSFAEVRASVIRSFPRLNLQVRDFSITYPHERYARFDSVYTDGARRFSLLRAGTQRGGGTDTLVALRELNISVNYLALLSSKTLHLHRLEVDHPRIFAHYYDSTAANWDILPLGGKPAEKDTLEKKESKPLPVIVVDKISLGGRPMIVYTNPADTLYGMFTMRRFTLQGQLHSARLHRSEASLGIDSLFVSGRLPADTVAFFLDRLRAGVEEQHFTLEADAKASLRTGSYGQMRLPLHLDADALLPEHSAGELEALINSLHIGVSALTLEGRGSVFRHADGMMDLDLQAGVKNCPVGSIARDFRENFPMLKEIPTDAILMSVSADARGRYGQGEMPLVNASVDQLLVEVWGSRIDLTASVQDALGKDPLLSLNGSLKGRVDSLTHALTREMGITGTGQVQAQLDGKARLSQLNMARIGASTLNCDVTASELDIRGAGDSLRADIPTLALNLCTRGNQIDKNIPKGARVLALKAQADTLNVSLNDMYIRGGKILLLAQNSAEILRGSKNLTPLMGLLKVGSLRLRDADGMAVSLRDNTETIRIEPATRLRPTPRLTLRSRSKRIRGRLEENLVGLRNLNFDLSATRHIRRPRSSERRARMLDSLQRVYPGVPRDSLFRRARMAWEEKQKADAFAGADISISLSKAVQEYVRDWDVQGNLGLENARIFTPAFPLKTSVSAVEGAFNNDTLNLKNITLRAGASDLSAQARLSGIRRALLGRRNPQLKLKAQVTSDYIDASELMRGYAYYSSYKPSGALSEASDEAVESAIGEAQLPDSAASKLLVIPSNLQVDFSLEAGGIRYDSLLVSWAAADVAMRDRTLQVTNALAASNMGDIYFEGFYSTRSQEDIKAGFDLNLVDITAEKVITLFPAVDTLMPLLTTFAGDLDCELAVTTKLDTCMRIVLPSLDGVMKISGKDLGLNESPQLTKITKLLLFRDNRKAKIDNMSVTGIVQNNVLEVFPFVLSVDRYLLAASGTQHLSQAFDYHLSVIKSPLILKFGVNVWGPDFDHIHYGLGRARYRSANVPVYTKQLDAVQYNLLASIHNIFELGVEKAMQENRTGQYFGSVEAPSTETSSSSKAQVSESSLQGMESFLGDVMQQTASRREALKREVLEMVAE